MIQKQKNNGKFDQKSRSHQISISRTPEEIPVTMIHQNHPHPYDFYQPFDRSDLARACKVFSIPFTVGALFSGEMVW